MGEAVSYTLVMSEKGGAPETLSFDKDEITIGRVKDNDIVLAKNNISKRHARIVRKDNRFKIIDLKSTNGTYINGRRIDGPYDLKEGDKIYVGDFTLELDFGSLEDDAPPPAIVKGDKRPAAGPPPPPEDVSDAVKVPEVEAEDDWGFDESPEVPSAPPPQAAAAEHTPAPVEEPDEAAEELLSESAAHSLEDGEGADVADEGDFDLDSLLSSAGQPTQTKAKIPQPVAPDAETGMGPVPVRPVDDATPAPQMAPQKASPPPVTAKAAAVERAAPAAAKAAEQKKSQRMSPAVSAVHGAMPAVRKRLLGALDLRRLDPSSVNEEQLRERASSVLDQLLDEMASEGQLPADVAREELKQAVLDEALGLGPIEELLQDDEINEIMVNGPSQIFVERNGKMELTDRQFADNQAVLTVIERIVARIGRRIDESSPMVDARLSDGSRVNAIVPPVALRGPCLTIRKFNREQLTDDDLVMKGSLTAEMKDFLETAVKYRQSVLISGGTGSGKTTTLNILSSFIPEDERIITIEDAAELRLPQPHVVSLETRPPNLEGRGEVAIRDLVRNALRMRPDRIVVGECRGGEALDMLQAMNTGHEGSLTTLHANTPRDALARLETLVLMSGMDLPIRAIRDQVGSAISVIVQQARLSDGSRRVTHITEVTGLEGDVITTQDLFVFEQTGFDSKGRVKGNYKATGAVPRFYEELKARGVAVDFAIFQ